MIIQGTNEVNLSSNRLIQEWIRKVGHRNVLSTTPCVSQLSPLAETNMLLKIKVGNVKIVLSMR